MGGRQSGRPYAFDTVYWRWCIPIGHGFGEDDASVTAVSRTEGSWARVGCADHSVRSILTQLGEQSSRLQFKAEGQENSP